MLDERVENGANGVHRIHWTQIDFSGKVHFSAIRERLGTRKSVSGVTVDSHTEEMRLSSPPTLMHMFKQLRY